MRGTEFVALQLASAAYTSDQIPEDWVDLSDEERDEWLSDNQWGPLEGFDSSEVLDLIATHASSIKDAFTLVQLKQTNELKNTLIAREIIAESFLLDDHEAFKNAFIQQTGGPQGFSDSPYHTLLNLQRGAESLGLQTYLVLATEPVEQLVESHLFNDVPPMYELLYLDHEDNLMHSKRK